MVGITVQFGIVSAAASASLGGVVSWQVSNSGTIAGHGYAASLAAAVTAASAVVNTLTLGVAP